jgi:hypothetical protein
MTRAVLTAIAVVIVTVGAVLPIVQTHAAAITWDGGGSDGTCGGQAGDGNKWSCALNWSGDTLPTSADAVTFNGTSTKDATVDASFTGVLISLNIASGYTGTITLARSLNTTSTFTQAAGSFTAANQTLDVDSSFSLSAGTFTASSGTMTFAHDFSISGSPTFNANGGTVSFDGGPSSSRTISCNNVTFSSVTFSAATNSKIVSSNCSLPLGANPTIPVALTLNGTLTGTGTLTHNSSTFVLNSGATFTGFTGLAFQGLSVAGVTADYSSLTSFSVAATMTVSSGSITLPNGADLNGALTITAGTFTAPSGSMTLAAALTISGSPTFNANGGNFIIDGGSGVTISCNNVTFNLVTLNNNGSKAISSNCSLPLGASPTVGTGITLSGTLSGSGTLTTGSMTFSSGATLTGFDGLIAASALTVNGATLNLGAYTTVDLNSSLIISSGTFTAPSGTMTLAGALTISGSPTFNPNGGTVTFDGAGATLSCNNVTFNLVTFNNTASKTISSNCSLPLGNNPTFSNAFNLSGTLSGTGTLTTASGTTSTLSAGATLSGFTGLVTNGTFSVAGATVDFSSYTTLAFGTNLTLSTGSLTLPPNASIPGGTLTISGGTFNAPSGTLGVSFLTISGSPTFNHNNGTVDIIGNSSGTFSCNNVTFNRVRFSSSSTKTINSNCSLPLGNNPTIASAIVLNGTLTGSGTLTSTYQGSQAALNISSVNGVLSGFNGLVLDGRLSLASNTTLNLSDYSPVIIRGINQTAALTLNSSATFTAPSGTMTLYDRFGAASDGSSVFHHNNGTIEFIMNDDDSSNGFQSCNCTFNNVIARGYAAENTFDFEDGNNYTFLGDLTITGTDSSHVVHISSDSPPNLSFINPQGSRTIRYATIQYMVNTNPTPISVGDGTVANWGNNSGFDFNASYVTNLSHQSLTSGLYTVETQPAFSFTLGDSNPSDKVSYNIQLDTDPNFSNPEVDYTFGLTTQGTHSFKVGQATNGGRYIHGTAGQTLNPGNYYVRVTSFDEAGNSSGWTTANSGKAAFILLDNSSFTINSPKSRQTLTYARPYIRFNQLSDPNFPVASYRVILNRYNSSWSNPGSDIVWMKDIDPSKPANGTTRTTSTASIAYENNRISLYGRGDTAGLEDGKYRLRIQAVDSNGSTFDTSATEFAVTLLDLQTEIVEQTNGVAETGGDSTPTPTASTSDEPGAKVSAKGYLVKIKVVDTNQKPVKGAKVVLHSTPREGTTDSQGLINFSNVEPGDHKVAISYKGQTGEQGITVGSDSATASPEVAITIRIQATDPFSDHRVRWSLIVMITVIITLLAALIYKRKQVKRPMIM